MPRAGTCTWGKETLAKRRAILLRARKLYAAPETDTSTPLSRGRVRWDSHAGSQVLTYAQLSAVLETAEKDQDLI